MRFERDGDPDAEPEKPRLGTVHRLALRRCDFKDVLSVRAKRVEHSGVLEMNGALMLFKWLGRSTRFHGKRLLVLLDAKAILCAVQKGRSSSRKLGRLLQRVGAHVLACDFAPRLLYVPTEDMPADGPSRGIRRRPARRRRLKPRGFSKTDRRLHRLMTRYVKAARVVEEHDGPDVWRSSSSSSSSESGSVGSFVSNHGVGGDDPRHF